MAIDWKQVEENNGSKFKNYAKPGIYKVKCIDVDIREVGSNGSVAQEFIFEEDDERQYLYPEEFHNGFYRMSVGLEDAEDIIDDLKQAFEAEGIL